MFSIHRLLLLPISMKRYVIGSSSGSRNVVVCGTVKIDCQHAKDFPFNLLEIPIIAHHHGMMNKPNKSHKLAAHDTFVRMFGSSFAFNANLIKIRGFFRG